MKRLLFISLCVAVSCWALAGQTSNAQSSTYAQKSGRMTDSPSKGDYDDSLINERREQREARRAQRLSEYEHYMDSLVLSHNFQFNPQTMQQQPTGSMRIINNPNYCLSFWNSTVDVCLPYIKGFTPPYQYAVLNYTIPSVSDLLFEQTHNGWTVSFKTSLYSAQTYTFTLEISSTEGGGTLTIASTWYSAVQYSGTITGLY